MILANEDGRGSDRVKLLLASQNRTVRSEVIPVRLEQDIALPREINLSGSQVLIGFASAICFTGLLLWVLLKLWLFE